MAMEGVLKFDVVVDKFVANAVPPTDTSYHLNVPLDDAEADNETEPVPQLEPATPVGADGTAFTIASTAVRDALVHDPLENST